VRREPPDLRTAFLAIFAWAGALTGAGHGPLLPVAAGGVLALAGSALARWRGRGAALAMVAGLVVYAARWSTTRGRSTAGSPPRCWCASRSDVWAPRVA